MIELDVAKPFANSVQIISCFDMSSRDLRDVIGLMQKRQTPGVGLDLHHFAGFLPLATPHLVSQPPCQLVVLCGTFNPYLSFTSKCLPERIF